MTKMILKLILLTLTMLQVMIPPHGEDRIELHHHWEEIILSTLKDVKFPKIRILNMAQVTKMLKLIMTTKDVYENSR